MALPSQKSKRVSCKLDSRHKYLKIQDSIQRKIAKHKYVQLVWPSPLKKVLNGYAVLYVRYARYEKKVAWLSPLASPSSCNDHFYDLLAHPHPIYMTLKWLLALLNQLFPTSYYVVNVKLH